MDEEFVTDGLQSDRYLKAAKLVEDFESEVTEKIDQVCREIINAHPDLIDDGVTCKEKIFRTGGSKTLATLRVEFAMNVENDEGNTLKLNLALEWVEPEQQGQEDIHDGSLCYVMYKVQHGSDTRFDGMKQRTEAEGEWDEIQFGEDQWFHPSKHAPGIVYIPVEDGPEIVDGLQTLSEHFSDEYVPELSD